MNPNGGRNGVALLGPERRLEPLVDALSTADVPLVGSYDRLDAVPVTPDCLVVLDAPGTGDAAEVNGLTPLEAALDRFDVPVVVYTFREGHEAIKAPLDVGATDVIRVPTYRPELIARRVAYAAGYGGEFMPSSSQLTSLLRNYPHTLFIKDDLGRFANVTTHTAGNYGFTREQLIGMTDYELFSVEHADDLWEQEQQIVTDGRPMINDIEEYVGRDGERRWVSTTKVPRHDDDGTTVGIVGGTQDVTPAKQQETLMVALHEASRQLSRATSRGEIASVTVEIATEIDYLPAVQVALTTPGGDLDPVDTSEQTDDEPIFDRYETAFYRSHERGETHYIDTDGSVRSDPSGIVDGVFEGAFESDEVGIVIPLGEYGVLGLVAPTGSVDDFTNRLAHVMASNVTAAFERAERERELAQKNRQLEEFATIGAHELRNRLQIALANVVRERAARDSERLEGVEQTLERMDRLLTQLLRLARTGKIPRTTDAVDVRRATERAWASVDADSASLSLPPATPIGANPDALTELFEFLFGNSVEHGGTDVAVDVGLLEDGFYVEDDGIGIPDDIKPDLFEVQYADAAQDSGYGLYIVSAIVDAHDWEIEVLDADSGGARFEVTGVTRL